MAPVHFPLRSLRLGLAALVACAAIGAMWWSVWRGEAASLGALRQTLAASGGWGVAAFGVLYAVAAAVFVPRTPLNLAAGWLYGTGPGFVVAFVCSLVASLLTYAGAAALSRRGGFDPTGDHLLAAVARAARRHPVRITALWHLASTLPFAGINAAMGAARAPLRPFLVGKLLGLAPGTLLPVWAGAALPDLAGLWTHDLGATPVGAAYAWAGLALGVALLLWIARLARAELRRAQGATAPPPGPGCDAPSGEPERARP